MASNLQIESNRINSKKSTGPTSETGKAATSQNALKTGIDAKTVVTKTEDRAAYDDLSARYFAQFVPSTEHERNLVDQLIICEWLRRRYLSIETNTFNEQFDGGQTSDSKAYSCTQQKLARVDRRLNSSLRGYTHALKQLQLLKSPGLAPPKSSPEDAAPVATEPLNPNSALFLISENPPLAPNPQPGLPQSDII